MKYNYLMSHWVDTIDKKELCDICKAIQSDRMLSECTVFFMLTKAFQFGYVYGKAAERARKKKGANHD